MALYFGGTAARKAAETEKRQAAAKRQKRDAERAQRARERAVAEAQRSERWAAVRAARVTAQERAVAEARAAGLEVRIASIPIEPPADFEPLPAADFEEYGLEDVDPAAAAAWGSFLTGGRAEEAGRASEAFEGEVIVDLRPQP
jgi:hypothetical protein